MPISGNWAKRVVHGALNVASGHSALLMTEAWTQEAPQAFLQQIRRAWRGWHLVFFEDQGSPHTAEASQELAQALGIELRWLPVATPELNAMEGLWRRAKDRTVANRTTCSIDESVDAACRYILDLSPRERLRQAGVLFRPCRWPSGHRLSDWFQEPERRELEGSLQRRGWRD